MGRKFRFFCVLAGAVGASLTPRARADDACELATGHARLCGRVVPYAKFCPEGPPPVTPAMLAAIPENEELHGEEEHFGCVSTEDGAKCPASQSVQAEDGLADHLLELHRDPAKSLPTFHREVTKATPLDKKRNDVAIVATKGYSRETVAIHMAYRVDEHGDFNGNAEGVDRANLAVTKKEQEAQEALAKKLGELAERFRAADDKASAKATGLYQKLAASRADLLGALACELEDQADRNGSIQKRLASLTTEADPTVGDGGGKAPDPSVSDVTGVGGGQLSLQTCPHLQKIDPATFTATSMTVATGTAAPLATEPAASTATGTVTGTAIGTVIATNSTIAGVGGAEAPQVSPTDEALYSYRNYEISAHSAPQPASEDDALFTRIHRKYQEFESKAVIYKTIID